jgi:sulfonate transport system permease protein
MSQTLLSDAPDRTGPTTGQLRGTTSRRPARGGEALKRVAFAVWLPLVLLAVWWVLSKNSTSPYFPPLSDILHGWWDEWVKGDAKSQLAPSLEHLLLGYVSGVLIGVIGGALLWRLPAVRRTANPLIYFLYVLPAPALLPAMIALFGIGEMRQIALIALGAIWPTLLNTLDGMRGIDELKFETARAMRLGPARQFFSLVLPGAAPQMAAGLRASLQTSIILMVVSEMVAATQGIGYFILQAQTVFAVTTMWTGIITLVLVGLLANYVFVVCERFVLRWHYRSRALGNS